MGTISRKINKPDDISDVVIIKKGKTKFRINTTKNENDNTINLNNDDKKNKIIDEIEEEKNTPWIREEDC